MEENLLNSIKDFFESKGIKNVANINMEYVLGNMISVIDQRGNVVNPSVNYDASIGSEISSQKVERGVLNARGNMNALNALPELNSLEEAKKNRINSSYVFLFAPKLNKSTGLFELKPYQVSNVNGKLGFFEPMSPSATMGNAMNREVVKSVATELQNKKPAFDTIYITEPYRQTFKNTPVPSSIAPYTKRDISQKNAEKLVQFAKTMPLTEKTQILESTLRNSMISARGTFNPESADKMLKTRVNQIALNLMAENLKEPERFVMAVKNDQYLINSFNTAHKQAEEIDKKLINMPSISDNKKMSITDKINFARGEVNNTMQQRASQAQNPNMSEDMQMIKRINNLNNQIVSQEIINSQSDSKLKIEAIEANKKAVSKMSPEQMRANIEASLTQYMNNSNKPKTYSESKKILNTPESKKVIDTLKERMLSNNAYGATMFANPNRLNKQYAIEKNVNMIRSASNETIEKVIKSQLIGEMNKKVKSVNASDKSIERYLDQPASKKAIQMLAQEIKATPEMGNGTIRNNELITRKFNENLKTAQKEFIAREVSNKPYYEARELLNKEVAKLNNDYLVNNTFDMMKRGILKMQLTNNLVKETIDKGKTTTVGEALDAVSSNKAESAIDNMLKDIKTPDQLRELISKPHVLKQFQNELKLNAEKERIEKQKKQEEKKKMEAKKAKAAVARGR